MQKFKKVLLIGGDGNLGSSIINLKLFKNLHAPSKRNLNLLKKSSINKILKSKYDLIINCAAVARMKECKKNPSKAINVNVFGTFNLIEAIINYETTKKKKIKLVHISTDAVYPSIKGNYAESSPLKPYNVYGWTKLCSESIVKMLDEHIIIRTRFFDKKNIKFETAATDIFTSMIEKRDLVKEIKNIAASAFIGTINIGDKKRSDFENYKKFKSNIKPCKRKDIIRNINFKIAKDASMNLSYLKKIKKNIC